MQTLDLASQVPTIDLLLMVGQVRGIATCTTVQVTVLLTASLIFVSTSLTYAGQTLG